jgi:cysteine dioxygenase
LSPLVEPTADSAAERLGNPQPLSLKALVEILESQSTPPPLAQLYDWLENSQFTNDELQPYLGFKDGTYWRHRVCRNPSVEMLVLCWLPGQRTVIHDHNGSQGAVLVQQGVVWETTFAYDEERGLSYSSACGYEAGQITGADVPDIHQLGNPDASERNLVTIHIYSPALSVLHTYKPGSTKVDLYTPDESDS